MSLTRIPLNSKNKNDSPISNIPLKSQSDNKDTLLKHLQQSNNTVRRGLHSRIPTYRKTIQSNSSNLKDNDFKDALRNKKPFQSNLSIFNDNNLKDSLRNKKTNKANLTVLEDNYSKEQIQNKKKLQSDFVVFSDNDQKDSSQVKTPILNNIFHRPKKQKTTVEPKLTFALPSQIINKDLDSDIFSTIDTPIHVLPNDCLITIFEFCQGFENYCTLLGVCRKWRYIASQPFLWKDVSFKWSIFSKQLDILHLPRRHFQQFYYIKSLTITDKEKMVIRNPNHDMVKIGAFKNIRELHLNDMNITDISFLINWLKHIQVLDCQRISVTGNRGISLSMFSGLDQLESLHLDFATPCSIKSLCFNLSSDHLPILPKSLPATLKSLVLSNTFDSEEALIHHPQHRNILLDQNSELLQQQQQHYIINQWLRSEDQLVLKYQTLASLSHLTSLSLGRVSSFTARVWRECLIPCGKNLKYLSMKGWAGKGIRESPQKILERQRTNQTDEDDVEVALSEFVASLSCIEEIDLDHFLYGYGIMKGIDQLDKKYKITVNKIEHDDIEIIRDLCLLDVNIKFI